MPDSFAISASTFSNSALNSSTDFHGWGCAFIHSLRPSNNPDTEIASPTTDFFLTFPLSSLLGIGDRLPGAWLREPKLWRKAQELSYSASSHFVQRQFLPPGQQHLVEHSSPHS